MENTSALRSGPLRAGNATGANSMAAVPSSSDRDIKHCRDEIHQYLLERVPVFRELAELRDKGWKNPAGDEFFKKQRYKADNCDDKQARGFFELMKRVGGEVHGVTGVFNIRTSDRPKRILDMCMAPGAFLHLAMEHNPGARARAFSLPVEKGGHKPFIPSLSVVDTDFIDITMLAADMGVDAIPPMHPDAGEFIPKKLHPEDAFDLVVCDGNVLRTHPRAAYREKVEPARLTLTQLVIALEHMKPGGSMLVLLHKVDSWASILTLRTFSRFSDVQVFKPTKAHKTRSSFYMVASNIQPHHEEAVRAVHSWKKMWKAATFGTEEEYYSLSSIFEPGVEEVLEDFGPKLIALGTSAWETQAKALANAPFVRESQPWSRYHTNERGI
ncbi:hypothetical protein F4802DRAFT_13638 [Xylaria palmicola]|nr:hypothetical protein F4802DRAFT_13638 [Xylaria palmicola]